MSLLILSSVEMILGLSSSMLAGRGRHRQVIPRVSIKRNHTGTSLVNPVVFHQKTLFNSTTPDPSLADANRDKQYYPLSLNIKSYSVSIHSVKFEVISTRISIIIGLWNDDNFLGHPTHTHTHTHIYIYIYIYMCVCVTSLTLVNLYGSIEQSNPNGSLIGLETGAVCVLLYGCTTWTLTKCLEKKFDGNYESILHASLYLQ